MQAYEALDREPQQAVRALLSLAERGSSMGMLYLGYAYANGVGVESNVGLAETWYSRAAGMGLSRAHYSLARLYLDRRQYADARREFEAAASAGFVPAVHFLGRIYYFGFGVPLDRERARPLLEQASVWGCVYAKALLGYDMMHEGKGIVSKVKGALIKLDCYIEAVRILWTEGISSDRFR